MNDEAKQMIDQMSYMELLQRWRFSPVGNELFQGEAGEYFAKRMSQLKAEVGPAEAVSASKAVGWG